jgi:hypothetical protein
LLLRKIKATEYEICSLDKIPLPLVLQWCQCIRRLIRDCVGPAAFDGLFASAAASRLSSCSDAGKLRVRESTRTPTAHFPYTRPNKFPFLSARNDCQGMLLLPPPTYFIIEGNNIIIRFRCPYTNLLSKVSTEKLIVVHLFKKFRAYMEPESSLLCSSDPATGHYLEQDDSIPHPHISFL